MAMKEKLKKGVRNILTVGAVAGILAGCAAGGSQRGLRADQLRDSSNFVTEEIINDMDFPTLQRHLFQHRAACGTAPRFVMQPGETGLATLFETQEIPQTYENVVLADLTQYQDSVRAPKRVSMRIYSYYYNDGVQKRIDRLVDVVRRPTVCQPN